MTEESKQIGNEAILASLKQEYKNNPLTPELVNKTWQTIWKIWGEGYDFQVPVCDRSSEELIQLREEKRMVLLIPDILYYKKGQPLLAKMFPDKANWPTQKDDAVFSGEQSKGGCIDVEIDSLYESRTNKTQAERTPQKQTTFVVGSRFNKFLHDRYFFQDRLIWAKPSSWGDGLVFDAKANDFRMVSFLTPSRRPSRSEGRKKVNFVI